MTCWLRVLIGPVLALAAFGASESSPSRMESYRFTAGSYTVRMRVDFRRPYVGTRLVVYSSAYPDREICLSDNGVDAGCIDRFVGAIALVDYVFERPDRTAPLAEMLCERVSVIDRASGVPDRPAFMKCQPIAKGKVSDVQVFGYDESAVVGPRRAAGRGESAKYWVVFRQELHLGRDPAPFAVLDWRHSTTGITLERVVLPSSIAAARP